MLMSTLTRFPAQVLMPSSSALPSAHVQAAFIKFDHILLLCCNVWNPLHTIWALMWTALLAG